MTNDVDDAANLAAHTRADKHQYVRVVNETVEWRCRACQSWQLFEADDCSICGTPRRRFRQADRARIRSQAAASTEHDLASASRLAPEAEQGDEPGSDVPVEPAPEAEQGDDPGSDVSVEPAEEAGLDDTDHEGAVVQVPPTPVLLSYGRTRILGSALLPGFGHWLVGKRASATVRLVLVVIWLVAGLSWAGSSSDVDANAGRIALIGGALVWVATVIDTSRLVHRRREMLGSHGLLWTSVVVTVALVVVNVLP